MHSVVQQHDKVKTTPRLLARRNDVIAGCKLKCPESITATGFIDRCTSL